MWYCNVLYPNSKSSSHFSKNIIKLRKGKMKDGESILFHRGIGVALKVDHCGMMPE